MSDIRIQTTQNVVITYRLAGVGDRILANLFDFLVMAVYLWVMSRLTDGIGVPDYVVTALGSLPVLLYHLLSETLMDGQTFGMKLNKIKVVRLDGGQPTLVNYLLRWMLRLVDVFFSFGVVGIVSIAASGKGQRVGDLAAGTTVASLRRKATRPDTLPPEDEETYALTYPQAANLTDRDAGIVREALHAYETVANVDHAVVDVLTQKVSEILGVGPPEDSLRFLRTVLRDHAYLTARV